MKQLFSSFLFFSLLLVIGCKNHSANTISEKKENTEIQVENEKSELSLISEGYLKATILDKRNSYDCGYLIELDEDKSLLYPLKLDPRFQLDQQKIWILYRPIRPIQANCPNANPIQIEGLQKRIF